MITFILQQVKTLCDPIHKKNLRTCFGVCLPGWMVWRRMVMIVRYNKCTKFFIMYQYDYLQFWPAVMKFPLSKRYSTLTILLQLWSFYWSNLHKMYLYIHQSSSSGGMPSSSSVHLEASGKGNSPCRDKKVHVISTALDKYIISFSADPWM